MLVMVLYPSFFNVGRVCYFHTAVKSATETGKGSKTILTWPYISKEEWKSYKELYKTNLEKNLLHQMEQNLNNQKGKQQKIGLLLIILMVMMLKTVTTKGKKKKKKKKEAVQSDKQLERFTEKTKKTLT